METYLCFVLYLMLCTGSNGYGSYDDRCQYRNGSFDCSNRQIPSIDCNFPIDVTNIDLSCNEIVSIPSRCFKGLPYMKSISINSNQLKYIVKGAFLGLKHLLSLDLYNNKIRNLPDGVFAPLVSLKKLNFYENQYSFDLSSSRSVLQQLSPLRNLRGLSIDINIKSNHSDCFLLSVSLESLELATYGMDIGSEIFSEMSKLKELNIHSVSGIEKFSFKYLVNLTLLKITIAVNNPNIDRIFESLGVFRGRNMSLLSVTGEHYQNNFHINKYHFKYLQNICLKQLRLKNLFISYEDPQSFKVFAQKSKCLEVFEMSHNRLLLWVPAFPELKVLRVPHFRTNRRIEQTVKGMQHFDAVNVSFPVKLKELHVGYTYSKHDFPGSVIVQNGEKLKVLDLAYIRFTSCNGTIYGLPNVQTFHISGWNCTILNKMLLSQFPRLQTFIARESFLGTGFKNNRNTFDLFKQNVDLRYVDISANAISRLPTGLFGPHLNHLQVLNLSNNDLHEFPPLFSQMSKLRVIDLRSNNIATIPIKMRDILDTLFPEHLYLGGNPFQCTCENIKFVRWLNTTNLLKSIDLTNMKCISETDMLIEMSLVVKDFEHFTKRCDSKIWIIITTTLCSIVIIVLILTIIFIRYKYAIEYMYITIKMKLRKYNQFEETAYEFQAFVSHSHLDTDWVLQLYKKLSNRGVEICFDSKDFIIGNSVAENILHAINKSRKVIFVITENFLESTWGSYELEMTRMHAFREDRDDMIIVVMKDDIPLHKMPKVLRNIWYKILCIKWHNQPANEFETEEVFYNRLYESISL